MLGIARCSAALLVLSMLAAASEAAASCANGVRDGMESDVDCGGDCAPCSNGKACRFPRDCTSGRCADGRCEERPYLEGTPVPPGYRVEHSHTDAAALTRKLGYVSLGVGYGTAYFAALGLPGELSWLYAPVIGPWVVLGRGGAPLPGLIVVNGVLQGVGAGLVIGGLIGAGKQIVRDEELAQIVRVTARPIGTGFGLGLDASF